MWVENLKQQMFTKKLKVDEVAKTAGMSRAGFYHSLKSESLRFDAMIDIIKKYNINFYALIGAQNPFADIQEANNEITCTNLEEVNKIMDKLKWYYESQIDQLKDNNKQLKDQVAFLQQVLAKNIGITIPVSKK